MTTKWILICAVYLLYLSLSVHCGVFNDLPTVTKARCYANCLTLISKQGLNDSSCESNQCLQCKQPCDQLPKQLSTFSVDKCNEKCNSSICKNSCSFIAIMRNWTDIYKGTNKPLHPPGVPIATSRNISQITLSWQPSTSTNSTIVYLLKKDNDGDVRPFFRGLHPIKGRVILRSETILTANDACNFVFSRGRRSFSGVRFFFTVVALTEESVLVEGAKSAPIKFIKADPAMLPNATIKVFLNTDRKLWLFISPTLQQGVSSVFTDYFVHLTSPEDLLTYSKIKITQNTTMQILEKTKATNIVITIHYLINCLPASKEVVYEYKGCHSIKDFDRTLCCSFQPENTTDSAKTVGNLTYSPLTITDDFRFNTLITWSPPTHSCPVVKEYSLAYGDESNWRVIIGVKLWFPKREATKNNYLNLTKLQPGTNFIDFKITPTFGSLDIGKTSKLRFNIPDVPLNKTSIQTVKHIVLPFSISRWFAVNISWFKPEFNYSLITSYNISYQAQDDVPKSNLTTNLWFIVSGLDYGQEISYQVEPLYRDPWIKTKPSKEETLRLPVPKNSEIRVKELTQTDFVENTTLNLYSMSFSWSRPELNRPVMYYQVSYTLSGYLDELQCPGNERCLSPNTTDMQYTVSGIRPKEAVFIKVKSVFENGKFYEGKETESKKLNAPDPDIDSLQVQHLTLQKLSSFNYNITWGEPLFKHSAVLYYDFSIKNVSIKQSNTRKRRATNDLNTTTSNFLTLKVEKEKEILFQISPKFKEPLISGQTKELNINNGMIIKVAGLSNAEIAGLCIGLILLFILLLLVVYLFWTRSRELKKNPNKGINPNKGRVIDQWEVSEDKLHLKDVIGEGAFGTVYKGILVELPGQTRNLTVRRRSTLKQQPTGDFVVAVKMLNEISDEQRIEFLKEIQLMKDVGSHRNIVNMLGCGTLSDPMFLIVEYLPNGDLLHYLRDRRGKAKQHSKDDPQGRQHSSYYWIHRNDNTYDEDYYLQPVDSKNSKGKYNEGFYPDEKEDGIQLVSVKDTRVVKKDPPTKPKMDNPEDEVDLDEDVLTPGDLMAFAWQVAQGMEFIAKRGYVHRDLAARNVLVGENKEAKIADFGLTRHMYDQLYLSKTNRRLPIKWMSIEAIFDQKFSVQSDVWAYGVFLWELVTLGGTPYPTKSNRELLKCIKDGYRMEKPETCDNEVYNIMLRCWEERPEDRPTFTTISQELEEMMMRDTPYFDPSSVDETREYYNVPSFKSIEDSNDIENDLFQEILGEPNMNDTEEGVTTTEMKDIDVDVDEGLKVNLPEINDSKNDGENNDKEPTKSKVEYTQVDFKTLNGAVEHGPEKEMNGDVKTKDLNGVMNGSLNKTNYGHVQFI